jgi:DNA-binding MarR family transcriptional regulator
MVTGAESDTEMREDLRMLVSYQIRLLSNRYAKAASNIYARNAGLTRSEWIMIAAVHVANELSVKAISRQMMYDQGLTSRIVKSLVKRHFLKRRVDPNDTRSTLVSLSASGREVVRRVFVQAKEKNNILLSCLTRSERKVLWRILAKLQRQAHEMMHAEVNGGRPERVNQAED